MEIIDPTRVKLEKGDTIPVFCKCGHIYQPERDSTKSRCPKCHKLNFHEDITVTPELRN